jgi:hypothetical protein
MAVDQTNTVGLRIDVEALKFMRSQSSTSSYGVRRTSTCTVTCKAGRRTFGSLSQSSRGAAPLIASLIRGICRRFF